MPKFLDAPSYYGSDGEELSLDMGYKTFTVVNANPVYFHKNMISYGVYRFNCSSNATVPVNAYGGGETMQSFTTMCMLSLTPSTAKHVWFEWGEGSYGYPAENEPSFHVVFHNLYCPSKTFGSGTTLQYSPGSTVVAVWGGANTSGVLGGHFYVNGNYILNSTSPSLDRRGSTFYAPVNPPTIPGSLCVWVNNQQGPGWVSGGGSANSGRYLVADSAGYPTWKGRFMHILKQESTSTTASFYHMGCIVINDSSTSMTHEALASWLSENSFNSTNLWYPAFGYFSLSMSAGWNYINRVYGIYVNGSAVPTMISLNGSGDEAGQPFLAFNDKVVQI